MSTKNVSGVVKLSPYERAINRLNDLPLSLDKIFSKALEDLRKQRDEANARHQEALNICEGYIRHLHKAEAERDQARAELAEANADVVQHKEERLRLRAEVSRLQRKIENAPCLAAREGEMTYECRVDNLCRACRWRTDHSED